LTSKTTTPPNSHGENKQPASGGRGGGGLRNVMMMGLVSFFADFSTEMVLGVLPLFVVKDLGASRAILGAMEGSAELTSYVLRMVSGSLSDKIGKRMIFVVIG
jgi:nitrate/nitrite transporter NarK